MTRELVQTGNGQTGLESLNTTFSASVPQLFLEVDRTKVKRLGIPLSSVFGTLQAFLGSADVNDFNLFGRTYQVRVQADQQYRDRAEDVNRLEVRNVQGQMVPLGTFVRIDRTFGAQRIQRLYMFPSAAINGEAATGFSSGQSLALMEQMADRSLPSSMGYEWTGMSYQEKSELGWANREPREVSGISTGMQGIQRARSGRWSQTDPLFPIRIPRSLVATPLSVAPLNHRNSLFVSLRLLFPTSAQLIRKNSDSYSEAQAKPTLKSRTISSHDASGASSS